ncbi:glycine/D-amino acid oxidase-like deaminating enzyme [Mesorhizobium soli]|uniref:NAD(P)/FAD-dependent oxidoreductase n=1 Tax=Pseudaminobacter soli (ex Li et al. 2025) TaxID=1295366 RepID=UPI00247722C0|nr:FAD-binding oxidoreductase [Mesorhizobium soli]MDH6233793.1 glycine/D-amino acid oxidase-like deaminating enzyme [Mesorhizobium soli]
MLNNPRSHGLWEASAPPAPVTVPLEETIQADVAIAGGGYAGLSCALHLAEAGKSVVLLEAYEFGFGGAGRNVGLINAGLWLMPDDVLAAAGQTHGERLLKVLGEGPALVMSLIDRHNIDCELNRKGTLHCAVGATGLKELRQRETQWLKRGAPVRLLDAQETADRVGTRAYAGALLDERAGTLQPLAYARGLARAAGAAGSRLHTSTPVVSAERIGVRWDIRTPRGHIDAQWLVVATDAYGRGPFRDTQYAQVRLPYFNLATQPLDAATLATILPGKEGVWDTKTILSSFRLDRSGRLVFGSVGALRHGGAAIHKGWARRALTRLFPRLAGIEFDHEWYGQIGMTDDAVPRLHNFGPEAVGVFGYNGRGISPGTVFGRELALLILGEKSPADLPLPTSGMKPAPLRGLKELYYEAGAQIAHLASNRI